MAVSKVIGIPTAAMKPKVHKIVRLAVINGMGTTRSERRKSVTVPTKMRIDNGMSRFMSLTNPRSISTFNRGHPSWNTTSK